MAQRRQRGWLKKENRIQGEAWVLYFRTTRKSDGRRVENKIPIGLVRDLPDKSTAWAEVERLHLPINPVDSRRGVTFAELALHYAEYELVECSESIHPNTTQLSYDKSYRLTTVTDPAGRHLYFTYASPTSFLATGVSSDFGLSLSYQYNQLGQLIKMTKPDSTTVSFQYDHNGYISAVLDNNGKVLESHTYDPVGRGLTSARAGGAEAITISYPQPPPYAPPDRKYQGDVRHFAVDEIETVKASRFN